MKNKEKNKKIIIISVLVILVLLFVGYKQGYIIGFDSEFKKETINIQEGSQSIINDRVIKGAKLEISNDEVVSIEKNKIIAKKEGRAFIYVVKGAKTIAEYEIIVEPNQVENNSTIVNETTTTNEAIAPPANVVVEEPTTPIKKPEEPTKTEPVKQETKIVEITGVEILNNNISLTVGNKFKLNYKVSPDNATDKSVTWSSSNDKVVSVNNGELTAKSVGNSTITIKTKNGKTASIKINVLSNDIAASSISLNASNKTISIGESFTLSPSIQPSNATNVTITWSSSNTSVATVNNGIIKGIKAGTAIITVRTNNGKTAICNVTVNEVSANSISLNKSSATIKIGESTTLSATVSPSNATNKTITWSSSNTSVATVNNGIIKGIKAGTATITAKTSNGKAATCTITVSNIDVTSVSLDKTSANIKVGETTSLTATVSPSNATNKTITWSSSDTSVATVENGTIKGIKAGTATITAKSNNGKIATCSVKIESTSCGSSKIHFMNTVESDAIIIESCGHFGLVDSSNPYNDGTAYSVSTYARTVEHVIDYIKTITGCGSKCKGKLDFVIATHSHSDHIGGMPRIASVFANSNTKYYYRKYVTTDDDTRTDWDNSGYYNRAYNAMKNAGATMIEVTGKSPTIDFYDLTINIMNTAKVSSDELTNGVAANENKNSLIQLVTHKNGKRVLLSGDMESQDEKRLKDKIGKVDVLKAGHHSYSSANSRAYLKALNADKIIVTNNKFVYPDNLCYATRINTSTKIYFTGTATDAIVLTFTDSSYNLKTQSGNSVSSSNPCKGLGWYKSGCWYYFDSSGNPLKGWQKLSWSGGNNWFYFKSDGCMLENTTQTINGKQYHFDSNGVCDSDGC